MSSLSGAFQSCTNGNSSASLTCSGTSCSMLQKIPGLTCTNNTSGTTTCTNGIKCATVANLTSSFAIQGNGLTISQTHNVSIGGQTYTLVGSGANFTNTNTTAGAKHSAAVPTHKAGFKLLMLVGFLLFSTQAFAQSTPADLKAIENQYDAALGSILDPLQVAMCRLVDSTTISNEAEALVLEGSVLEVCLADLMITILGAVGTLVDADEDAQDGMTPTAYGSSLPISDPETLFIAAAGNTILCLSVAAAILNDPSGTSAASICAPIIAAAPATAGAPPAVTVSGSSPTSAATVTSYPVPSPGLPSSWPAESAFANDACLACQLSGILFEIQTTGQPCNITNPPINAWLLASWMCQPDASSTGFGPVCAEFCNNQCATWAVDAVIAGMGNAYTNSDKYGACFDICANSWNDTYVACPLAATTDYDAVYNCTCGTGFSTCQPVPANNDCEPLGGL